MIKKSTIFMFFMNFLISMGALKLLDAVKAQEDFIFSHGGETFVRVYPIAITGLVVIGFLFMVLSGACLVNIVKQYRRNIKLYKAANQGYFRK